jgi:tripartite-type tricarboxylate transporter receptor subunit TctC
MMCLSVPAFTASVVLLAGFAVIGPVAAQNYPARPVRVINPFAPGGGLDIVLRPALQKMGDSLKQGFVVDNRPGAAGIIKAGKLRAMGIAAEKRSAIAPEIPTVAESGGPAMILASWYGLLAPAGTPREIVAKLHAEVVKALALPDLRERYVSSGIEPVGSSPDQFAAEIRGDIARWAKVARAANIRAE